MSLFAEAVCAGVAVLVYINTLGAEFVYDDSRAIVKNLDVRSSTPLTNIFFNDYWGTPMTHSGSHKSYRPVTSFTFRLNYAFFGLKQWSYHFVNILLHGLATGLFTAFAKRGIFREPRNALRKSLLAGVLFALHPIHTEAVAGVVGRADVLSAVFVFAALLSYSNHCDHVESGLPERVTSSEYTHKTVRSDGGVSFGNLKSKKKRTKNNIRKRELKLTRARSQNNEGTCHHTSAYCDPSNISESSQLKRAGFYLSSFIKTNLFITGSLPCFFAVLAIFSKEIGFCALPLCIAYDVWIRNELGFISILKVLFTKMHSIRQQYLQRRLRRIIMAFFVIICVRVLPWILFSSGTTTPSFSSSDNPASSSESFLTRSFTFNYLIVFNAMLLVFPITLSYDWGGISLVESFADTRTLYTIALYMLLGIVVRRIWRYLRDRDIDFENNAIKSRPLENENPVSVDKNDRTTKINHSDEKNNNRKHCSGKTFSPTLLLKALDDTDIKPSSDNQIEDEGVLLCASEEAVVKQRCADDESLTRLMLDHVKDRANCVSSFEVAESTNSSGYATESSEEGRDDVTRRSEHKSSSSVDKMEARKTSVKQLNFVASDESMRVVLIGMVMMVIPFLPATNLFFYVGFIVAERILYLPSAGYCVLVIQGWYLCLAYVQRRAHQKYRQRISQTFGAIGVILLTVLAARTVLRNWDWQDEFHLYRSGTSTSPAKSWSNLGNVMKDIGRIKDAETSYLNALRVRGNMADVHYNLGLLYQEQKRYTEALDRYRMAVGYRKTLAVAYLNTGIVLAELGRTQEAEKMYRFTAAIDDTGLRDPLTHAKAKISAMYNLGCLLSSQNKHVEAEIAFRDAISRLTSDYEPQSLYNMLGQSLYKLGKMSEAEKWFDAALDFKPDHIPAHLTRALLMRDTGRVSEAKRVYEKAMRLDPDNHLVYNHFTKLHVHQNDFGEAAKLMDRAFKIESVATDYETVMYAGDIYRRLEKYSKAEKFYRRATRIKPDLGAGHINLGATLHIQEKYSEAKKSYEHALYLDPNDDIAMQNLKKLNEILTPASET